MYAFAVKSIKIGGQSGYQRFAFTGFHFGNLAVVQNNTADELDVVMALAKGAFGGLADDGKSLGQELVQGFALFDAGAEFVSLGLKLLVA